MRLTRTTVFSLADDRDQLRALMRQNIASVIGLALIALAAALAAALATWSINDPSFSHATSVVAQNVLGRAGASAADLMMQTFGLAASALPLSVALVGWRLLYGRHPGRFKRRAGAWLVAMVLLSAAIACLPRPDAWPLPTGLGGVAGDLTLLIPAVIIGAAPSGLIAVVLAFAFAVAAAIGLAYGLGFILGDPTDAQYLERRMAEPLYESEDDADEFIEQEDTSDGDHRFAILGALTHWVFVARARLRRGGLLRSALSRIVSAFRTKAPADDGLGDDDRIEPHIDLADEDWPQIEHYDQPVDPPPEGEEPSRKRAAKAAPRIQARTPKPKAGRRLAKEAQVSFFGSGKLDLPSLHLLSEPRTNRVDIQQSADSLEQNARILEGVLEDFGVRGEIFNVRPGPVVTLYELEPAPGIKSSRVIGLADDIARSMSAISARVAVIPGKNAIGIELPNQRRETVYLRELLASRDFEKNNGKLPLCLGKNIGGEPIIADLTRMPHLLVAGTTGSGKSVSINTMILSLLYRLSPVNCKMIMIDPKMLELSVYDGIPHLLTPVVTDPKKAVVALKWTVREMEGRYKQMSKLGVRNIDGFNTRVCQALKKGEVLTRTVQTGFDRDTGEAIYEHEELDLQPMPFIVVVVDEMADLMMVAGKDIEGAIQRLAQMARAAGIHLIMATQRPSVDVITGTIKANFPTRISFQVTSKIDSRTILGEQGAEQLLGQGDLLYMAGSGRILRVHGPFVSDEEVEQVVAYLKTQGVPEYLSTIVEEDANDQVNYEGHGGGPEESNDLYDKAVAIVLRDRKASTSYVQRRLSIGYNRAATIIERMEEEGVVGPANHAGKREILVGGENETI
jgi:S-DNA-T family DNA segregation ATPase FtsK/SpoIIIE